MKSVNRNPFTAAALLVFSLFSLSAQASLVDKAIKSHQTQWALANYQLEDDAQKQAFERLLLESKKTTELFPDSPAAWAWSGIIKSSYGAAKGGLGALSLVKSAKTDFEKALALDSQALNGSTHASLAVLYHKVPGWPIGFGDDDKAEQLFKNSMKINPDGRESNYFYGEFLYDERKYAKARTHLLAAKNVPMWQDRPIAYKNRQKQIDAMLEKVEERLAKRKNRR